MMRIAVYHNQPPGGARRALNGFCTVLARRNHLDVFTLTTADHSMLSDNDYGGAVTALSFETGTPVRGGFVLNELIQLQTHARLDEVSREAATLIDAGAYDVALVDTCRFTFAPQVLKYLKTPAVYYCHHGPWRTDGMSEVQARSLYENARHVAHMPFRQMLERNIRRQDRELTRQATAVATNSEFSRTRLRETCGVEVEVCPPGIAIPPKRPRREAGYVLSVGDLVPHKGHHLVVRAMANLPSTRKYLHIVATGGGRTYASRLTTLAQELGVHLLIREAISDAELASEYLGASLFAFGARREPLGLAPIEAMAHALPVVAIAEGGVTETVTDGVTGFLVAPDPAVMGDRIARLMQEPELRDSMGEAGRTVAESLWSCDVRTPALEALLVRTAAAKVPVPA